MDTAEVDFIGKMILDEVMELFATVLPPAETKTTLKGFIGSSKDIAQIEGKRAFGKSCYAMQQYMMSALASWFFVCPKCGHLCT